MDAVHIEITAIITEYSLGSLQGAEADISKESWVSQWRGASWMKRRKSQGAEPAGTTGIIACPVRLEAAEDTC